MSLQAEATTVEPSTRCVCCPGVAHPATGSVLPSGRVVCAGCVRRFWNWMGEHALRRFRVGPKRKGARYIPFPTGVEFG